jgi:hypothetical protein
MRALLAGALISKTPAPDLTVSTCFVPCNLPSTLPSMVCPAKLTPVFEAGDEAVNLRIDAVRYPGWTICMVSEVTPLLTTTRRCFPVESRVAHAFRLDSAVNETGNRWA